MRNSKIFLVLLFISSIAFGQETPKPNYRQAAKYSPKKLAKLVHSTSINPSWLKKGNRFWYQYKTSGGSNYYLVDADKRTRTRLFDNVKIAKWLTEITKDPYDAKHLPKFSFKFNKNETTIRFRVTSTEEVDVIDDNEEDDKKEEVKNDTTKVKKVKKKKKPKKEKKSYHLEYRLGANRLTIVDNKKEKNKGKRWANIAPDSSIVLFSKKYNLYWMDKVNFLKAVKDDKDSTIVEHQWTKDGLENYGYGGGSRGENNESKEKNKEKRKGVWGTWSRDSKKFVFQKSDSRHIKDLWVINSVTKNRPTLETYKYHMPGEQEYAKSELLIFDIPSKRVVNVALDTIRQQSISVYRAPRKQSDWMNDSNPSFLLVEIVKN